MLLLKIWILTVIFHIVWTILMKLYYKNNIRASFNLMTNPYQWHIILYVIMAGWNVIGLFLVLIYFLFIQ